MNAARRKTIADIANRLPEIEGLIEGFTAEIESVLGDEQDAFDNMPEGLQGSERGEQAQAALDSLQEAMDALETAKDAAIEAVSALETAAE